MSKIVVVNHVTLDGVIQGPGRPDEDTRDGFAHGGWAASRNDEVMGAKVSEWMNGEHAFLFGRLSYEIMLSSWNRMGGPCNNALNNTPKYVASKHSNRTLEWPNSTLLHGDVPAAVSELKQTSDANLVMMGSGELIGSWVAAELVDVFVLMIHPLPLGTGRRLFADGVYASLRLADSAITTRGCCSRPSSRPSGELVKLPSSSPPHSAWPLRVPVFCSGLAAGEAADALSSAAWDLPRSSRPRAPSGCFCCPRGCARPAAQDPADTRWSGERSTRAREPSRAKRPRPSMQRRRTGLVRRQARGPRLATDPVDT